MSEQESAAGSNPVIEYLKDFAVLKDCPLRFWGVQVVNIFDALAYFTLFAVITIFLSDEFGLSDEWAGYVYTIIGGTISVSVLIGGPITDWLGTRKSLHVALLLRGLTTLGVGWMAWDKEFASQDVFAFGEMMFTGRVLLMVLLFVFMGFSMSMMRTTFQAANKRFSSKAAQGPAFNLWYLFMNLGAVFAGLVVSLLMKQMGLSTTYVVFVGIVTSALGVLATLALIRSDEAVEEAQKLEKRESPWKNVGLMLQASAFWKTLLLVTLLLAVRSVFLYIHAIMTKYWVRVIGNGVKEDVDMGMLLTINPILIVIGLIVLIPLLKRVTQIDKVFNMLIIGAFITVASMLILAIPGTWFSADVKTGYYTTSILFMILLSVGEVLWSPRLEHYIAAVAPKGQEGAYFSLSAITWFGAKMVIGLFSGHMLEKWCPEGIGEQIRDGAVGYWDSPEAMYLILALAAIPGLVVVWWKKSWFTEGVTLDSDDEAEEGAPA